MPGCTKEQQQERDTAYRYGSITFRWLFTGILLSVVFFSLVNAVYAVTLTAGDLAPRGDTDGQLNAADLLILQQFVLGKLTPVGDEMLIADVAPPGNTDGELNAGDIAVLARAINGLVMLPPVDIGPDAPVLDPVSSPTSNNPQTITGTATANIEVRLYVNGVQQDAVMADGGGAFSFQAVLFDGINDLYATAWDGADESTSSNQLALEYINNIPRSQGGTITQDTVWTPGVPNDPYIINSDLTIANGASLILLPGAEVQFPADYTLQVDGELIVLGATGSPVVFTSNRASPAADNWQGIYVSSSATRFVMEYAEIRYADRGIEFATNPLAHNNGVCDTFCVRNSIIENNRYGLYLTGASPWIEANTIQNNTRDGIWLATSSPTVTGNTIQNNGSNYVGIRVGNASNPVITGNVITGQQRGINIQPANRSSANNPLPVINGNALYGNSNYDLYAYNYFDAPNVTLDATGNWWGTTDPTAIAAAIYDHQDNATYGPVVDFSGYLDGMGGSPVVANTLLGTFSTDTTLVAGMTYEVLGDITVPAGVTLTIEAGVTLRFDGGTNQVLTVDGALVVQGTALDPVVFTSGQGAPAANDWQGIFISSSATQVVIDHAVVQYAENGVEFEANTLSHNNGACDTFCVRNSIIEINQIGLYLTGAAPWIEGNTVQNHTGSGIYLEGASPWIESNQLLSNLGSGIYISNSSPEVRANTIQGNGNSSSESGIYIRRDSTPLITAGNDISGNRHGIYVTRTSGSYPNPAPVVTGNNIYSNTQEDYYAYLDFQNPSATTLNATGNWWGTTDPASIGLAIYDHSDSAGSPVVDFQGYLDGLNGSSVAVNTLLGAFSTNTTLTPGATYEVLGSIQVPAGFTLTIPAGVTLRFDGGVNTTLQVDGDLIVQGLQAAPVVLESGQVTPGVADWKGILVSSSVSNFVLDYAEVRYADRAVEFEPNAAVHNSGQCDTFCVRNSLLENSNYGLYLNGAAPWIEANAVQGNVRDGIYLIGSSPYIVDNIIRNNGYGSDDAGLELDNASHPTVTGNVLTGQRYGILMSPTNISATNNPFPVVTNNALYGNTENDLYADRYFDAQNITLDMTGNWWGTTDPAAIAAAIHDRQDATTNEPFVDFQGYLDGFPGNPVSVNSLTGSIQSNTTLLAGQTYEVLGDVAVPAGVILTIEAGAILRFNSGAAHTLRIDGGLIVEGTADDPVEFTSGQSVPAAQDWQGIFISSTATQVVIDHAVIRYADNAIEFEVNTQTDSGLCDAFCVRNTLIEKNRYGIYIIGASPRIESNIIQYNTQDGIYLMTGSPQILGNTIFDNVIAGLRIRQDSDPGVYNNLITDNNYGIMLYGGNSVASNPVPVIQGNGLFDNGTDLYTTTFFDAANTTIDATGNWWGTTYPDDIQAQVRDHSDSTSAPVVDVSGFLDAMNGNPVSIVVLQGDLVSNATFTAGTIYEITGTLRIVPGVTLMVDPGAILRFNGNGVGLLNEGSLVIHGTAAVPVILTSAQSQPSSNDWQGVVVASTASATIIDYAEISYAVNGVEFEPSGLTDGGSCNLICVRNSTIKYNDTGLFIAGADPWIKNNLIEFNDHDGVFIISGSPTIDASTIRFNGMGNNTTNAGIDIRGDSKPNITGNLIYENVYDGIYVQGENGAGPEPLPVITGNAIYNNQQYDLRLISYQGAGSVTIDANNNWWGTTDPATIANRIYDNNDNPDLPVADVLAVASSVAAIGVGTLASLTQNLVTIRPGHGELLEVSFDLSVQSSVELAVYDERTRTKVYSDTQLLSAGTHMLTWDGRDDGGNYVPSEAYVYQVRADNNGQIDVLEPVGGGLEGDGTGTSGSEYNAFKNEFWSIDYSNDDVPSRVSMRITPEIGRTFYPIEEAPYESGITLTQWDGRDPYGNIVTGNTQYFFEVPRTLPTNLVIVRNEPVITGNGAAPEIEVKSNPYRIWHSYDQFSQITYRVDRDSHVTVKLLPPGITSINSIKAITLTDNVLTSANDGGGQPIDHVVEWTGYDVADTNDIQISDEGTYTFVIEATDALSGFSSTYRGSLQLYQ